MPVKLFVGGLSFTTTNESLRGAFARFGAVTAATVMTDRATGRSRGFGFVEMATPEEAERAIGSLNNTSLDGRMIRVDKATPRGSAPPPRSPGARPGGPPRPSGPGGPPGGGFDPRAGGGGWDPRAGGGRSQGRPARRRPGDDADRKPPSPRRKPGGERRAGDKGRRSEEGFRW
ncbi:MAG: RNA recognition motif domain-containing protein [Candidatus Rokuibacteriota bacterium]